MTKQEKIQEAYGVHWENVKDFVNENGWIDCKSFYQEATHRGLIGLTMEVNDPYDSKYCYWKRPVSLSGIDNNNDWIRIESEDDLPKEEINCWFLDKNKGAVLGKFIPESKGGDIQFILLNATHYKIVENPNPPIY